MMLDASRIAHSTGGDYDLGLCNIIYIFRFIRCNGKLKSLKAYGIYSAVYKLKGLFIEAILYVLIENKGGTVCKRRIHPDLEVVMVLNASLLLDLADEIEHFLSTAYGK